MPVIQINSSFLQRLKQTTTINMFSAPTGRLVHTQGDNIFLGSLSKSIRKR